MFILGAGIGSITTWFYVKNKYEQIAQDEIDSVKEAFSVRVKAEQAKEKYNVSEYAEKLRGHGYTKYSDSASENKKSIEPEQMDKPYIISPDEFGELDEYDKISLYYYTDKILTDDDVVIEDVDNVVGFDALNRFGEYEEDAVFVRNDTLKCDYEILRDRRKYSDVVQRRANK
jgi:hypothetical protein